MKVKERLLDELDELDARDLLRVYEDVLVIKEEKRRARRPEKKSKAYMRCREALSGCKGNLSDDIIAQRQDRI